MDPELIAEHFASNPAIETAHSQAASQGSTAPPSLEERVTTHFCCFVHVAGHLYELDGRKTGPVNHGVSSQETLLVDSCRVIQGFMDRDPEEHRFTIVALAAASPELATTPQTIGDVQPAPASAADQA